jgi:hypothetical protein
MVEKWKLFEGDLQDLRTCTGTKLPMNKNSEFETVLAQFLVDLNTPSSTGVTNGVKSLVVTELPKISILETRAALPIIFISLVYSLSLSFLFPSSLSPLPLFPSSACAPCWSVSVLHLSKANDSEKQCVWEIQIPCGIRLIGLLRKQVQGT